MKVHIIGAPHICMHNPVPWCAYSHKAKRVAELLSDLTDATVIQYCCEQYSTERRAEKDRFHDPPNWNASDPFWNSMSDNLVPDLISQSNDGDILAVIFTTQVPIQTKCKQQGRHLILVELGIGYEGYSAPYSAFESAEWMNYVYGNYIAQGLLEKCAVPRKRPLDTVIPNPYHMSEFKYIPVKERCETPYVLTVCRKNAAKGVLEAIAIVGALRKCMPKLRLKLVGPHQPTVHFEEVGLPGNFVNQLEWVDNIGVIEGEEKKHMFANASLFVLLTQYVAPYEGAHVEAALSGVPCLVSNHGVYNTTSSLCPATIKRASYSFKHTVERAKSLIMASNDEANRAMAERIYDWCGYPSVAKMYIEWFQEIVEFEKAGGLVGSRASIINAICEN
jgi:glycosyltransferase involved in cell wall biosynthesis